MAAELGIADALTEDPLPLDNLADRVGADPEALRRLMRALISRGYSASGATAAMS